MLFGHKTFITQPLLPQLEEFMHELEEIWNSKSVTNMGNKHNQLENELRLLLKTQNLSLFNNGTIALLVALKALDLPYNSEVITTPFTFAATPHSIVWNGLKPVFCDIEPETMCIDADKIESLITPNTSAILAVHVYGFPCNVEKIEKIAKKHNLKVIYDAAHAFLVEIDGRGIGTYGDLTMFSFHATKLFNTIEGGCLAYQDESLLRKIYNLRNFGIKNEEIVEEVGINGKMNELQAIIGLLNLKLIEGERTKRSVIKSFYDEQLSKIDGIKLPKNSKKITNSLQYYPIIIEKEHPLTRDELYNQLKIHNIISRKYFFPICSNYECYKNLESSSKDNLPVANDIQDKILCLPFYGDLNPIITSQICKIISSADISLTCY
jgi:dTDP-4-amino-4,6-dideoxygalactose transaminase